MKRPPLRESDIQGAILDYLRVHRVFHWRANSGAFQASHNGKQRFIKFGTLGQPDIMAIHKGRFIGIEVKRMYGEQSQSQVEFQADCERAGGVYVLARSVEDVMRALEKSEA